MWTQVLFFVENIRQPVRYIIKFGEHPFLIIACLNLKSGLNRVNTSLSLRIPNIKIFEHPGDFTPYISASV